MDHLAHLAWLHAATWRDPKSSVPEEPKPLPRPGIAVQDRRSAFLARFRALSS